MSTWQMPLMGTNLIESASCGVMVKASPSARRPTFMRSDCFSMSLPVACGSVVVFTS